MFKSYKLLMSDQIRLKAIVARPKGDGPFPIVLMPSSWALNYLEYVLQARKFTKRGYVVVSYTSRGFWNGEGMIDVADQRTVKDVSEIIDWTLKTQKGDPQRIAVGGISYGAGISLLAASRDERINAVFCLSGWTDLSDSLFFNQTVSSTASYYLGDIAKVTGNLGPELKQLLAESESNSITDETMERFAPDRSAVNELPALNTNRPAILLINAWGDSVFPPTQFFKFFEQYTGTYRLILKAGDHATLDFSGLAGLPNESWQETIEWLDQHINATTEQKTATSAKLYTNNTQKKYDFPGIKNLPVLNSTYHLAAPAGEALKPKTIKHSVIGELSELPLQNAWQQQLEGGLKTGANSGYLMITGLLQGWFQVAKSVNTQKIARAGAAAWRGENTKKTSTILGMPHLNLQLKPTRADFSIMVYLYDEDENGWSKLITHAPYSQREVTAGEAIQADIQLHAIHYELAKGHRLMVAIDTKDHRYASMTDAGDSITISATPTQPALLHVPFLTP